MANVRDQPGPGGAPPAHLLPVHEALTLLGTDPEAGLGEEEAVARLRAIGPNEMPPPRRRGAAPRALDQFRNPLVVILVASALVTAALGEWTECAVIAGVVLLNAVIGFLQESRAESALAALRTMTRTEATVVRAGRARRVPAEGLVPGDLVLLDAGDRVPADLRLIAVRDAWVDESMLTGESVPVAKHDMRLPADTVVAERANLAHAGTLVVRGRARGVVVGTGGDTELGRVHRLVGEAQPLETPLTRRITDFSRIASIAILALAAATFALGLARGEPPPEMFTAAVALAVGAIPEGLPAAVTITLAIGVARMARRRAVVRRLPAAETLGGTTVICTDKTGTLTENRMTVTAAWAAGRLHEAGPDGALPRDADVALRACLETGVWCNDAALRPGGARPEVVGDPTEGALLLAAERAGVGVDAARARAVREAEVPFDASRGWMATLDRVDGERRVHLKGAPERVLERCAAVLGASGGAAVLDADEVLAAAGRLGGAGLRVLALARAPAPPDAGLREEDVRDAVLVGLQAMHDPPRATAVAAVATCRDAGIAVKMVTGDQPDTARTIAGRVGIRPPGGGGVVTGADLAATPTEDLPGLVESAEVFARVSPEQKLRLVEALQARGHVVAMTGDGVNDAPALRRADIGVAMGRDGTEVAKEAADIVLGDDDFATIAAAVEEGRRVFDNLTKFIVWTLPTNLGEGLVIVAAILAGATLPILPTQILWINMTTAVALGLMLAFEPVEPGAMRRPPRSPSAPLLTPALVGRVILVSCLMVAGAFGLFEFELALGATMEEARTVAVNVFVAAEAVYLFGCRSLSGARVPLLGNPWLTVGVLATVLLQAAFTYAPAMQRVFDTAAIGPAAWGRIAAVALLIGAVVAAETRLVRAVEGRRTR